MTLSIPIIDADSHVSEPADLWTSRMSAKRWGDDIPRVVMDERMGRERWVIGDSKLTTIASWASAGWHRPPPDHPPTMDAADPAAFFAEPRLAKLDEYGIYAQVLYPNLLSFTHHAFTKIGSEFATECARAYNDFLVDFAAPAPKRFVLLAVLPFWDVDAAVAEIDRCAATGSFSGVLFIAKPHRLGLPPLSDDHWRRIFDRVNEVGWSMNFHTGFAEFDETDFKNMLSRAVDRRHAASRSASSFLNNAESMGDIIMSGLCERYPDVDFVFVESAFGWIPMFVESMDWQWDNIGASLAYPDQKHPSYYFRRQVYGMFWFETDALKHQIELYPDNVMFETDFPHPTSLSPGPASPSLPPDQVAAKFIDGLPHALARKILWGNAARVYGVEEPPAEWTARCLDRPGPGEV